MPENYDLPTIKTAEHLLNWLSYRFLFTEKIKHGDIRLCFLITETEYAQLRNISPYLNSLTPDASRLEVVRH